MMRRNIMRYSVLAYVITLMRISLRVKRRFPTHQHLVDAGIMLDSEKKIFEIMDAKSPMSKYWMPLVWATNIINRARKEKIIESDHIVQTLLVELSDIRRRLGALIGYDTVCVPLVYTQVRWLSMMCCAFATRFVFWVAWCLRVTRVKSRASPVCLRISGGDTGAVHVLCGRTARPPDDSEGRQHAAERPEVRGPGLVFPTVHRLAGNLTKQHLGGY